MSEVYQLVNAQGEVAPFTAEQARKAYGQGWKPATPDNVELAKNAGSLLGATGAVLEGAASGATFGLSNLAEKSLGVNPRAMEARKEANPFLHGVSELAGSAVPFSAVAKGLGLLGMGARAANVAAASMSGGLEGSVGTISNALLQHKELRGEEVAQHALQGALSGALFGAAGEAVGAGLGKLADTAGLNAEAIAPVREALSAEGDSISADKLQEVTSKLRDMAQPAEGEARLSKAKRRMLAMADRIQETVQDGGKFSGTDLENLGKEYAIRQHFGDALGDIVGGQAKPGSADLYAAAGAAATGHPLAAALAVGKNVVSRYLANPEVRARLLDSLSGSEKIVQLAQQASGAWDHNISKLLEGGSAVAAAPTDTANVASYDSLVKQVRDAAQNPNYAHTAVQSGIGADLYAAHPAIADHAALTASSAIQYLAKAVPQTQAPGLLDAPRAPSAQEKQAWLNAYKAVTYPQSVAHNPTEEGLAALQAVYPASHDAAVTQILGRLQGKTLSYQQKLRVGRLLGPSAVSDLAPDQIQFAQTLLGHQEGPPKGQKGSARNVGAQRAQARKMDFEQTVKDNTTQIQRLQGK